MSRCRGESHPVAGLIEAVAAKTVHSRPTVQAREVIADKPGVMLVVAKKNKLADCSWAELKGLSWAIAAAGSDEEELAIATCATARASR